MTWPRPSVVFAGTGAALALLVAFGSPSGVVQGPSTAVSTLLPVQAAALVCPLLASDPRISQATLLTAASPAEPAPRTDTQTTPSTSVPASLRLDLLGKPATGKPLVAAASGGRAIRYVVPPGAPRTFVVRATGSLARSLSAQSITRTAAGPGRSLAAGQCAAPAGEFWFVGGGAAAGRTTTLLLTNIDSAPATVDVTVFGAKGAVNPEAGQGRLVAPGKQLAIALDSLAPGEVATAVHAVARAGRFAASLFDTQVTGLIPGGTDWVPESSGPNTAVVVPGIASAAATRSLSLLVPGDADATVRIGVSTADGVLTPAGFDAVTVPAGQLLTLDLKQFQGAGTFAFLIDSDQPILAGLRVLRGSGAALPDFAYSTGRPALSAPLELSNVLATSATAATIQLTAGRDNDASVLLAITPAAGIGPAPQTVSVPAGRTVTVALGPGLALGGSVVVSPVPGSGPVFSSLSTNQDGPRGPLLSTWMFVGTPFDVRIPAVRPDPGLALPAD